MGKYIVISILVLVFSFYSLFIQNNNSYSIIKTISRNELYYTQGMFFDTDNTIIESGGLYGESVLVRMEYPSMEIIKKVQLEGKYFAEGVARCNDFIYQLTWRERKILKYSYPDLILVKELNLDNKMKEGWGLTSDGKQLFATDGTHKIYIIDCMDLEVKKTVAVFENGKPVNMLNDLAIVEEFIFANRYFDTRVFKIDLNSGVVLKTYDFDNLVKAEYNSQTLSEEQMRQGNVLNGIMYHEKRKIFILTGKMWGNYYEIKLN